MSGQKFHKVVWKFNSYYSECWDTYYVPYLVKATTKQANRRLGDVKQTLSPKRPRVSPLG